EERGFLYKKLDRQAQLRHVVIDLAKEAPAEATEAARKQIDEAAAQLKAGKQFPEVAKRYSTEEFSKKKGGLIGWRKRGFTGLGDALDKQVFEAKPGQLLGPERTERGFELVRVEDFREGDVPFEVAAREIAEEKLQAEHVKARAKAEADAVMARL